MKVKKSLVEKSCPVQEKRKLLPGSRFSKDERSVLRAYRRLSAESKRALLEFANTPEVGEAAKRELSQVQSLLDSAGVAREIGDQKLPIGSRVLMLAVSPEKCERMARLIGDASRILEAQHEA